MRFKQGQQVNVRLVENPDVWTRGEILRVHDWTGSMGADGRWCAVMVNGKVLAVAERDLAELDLGSLVSSVVDELALTMGMERLPARAEALREAAESLEHSAEFNLDRTRGWSAAEIAENNRMISQSRELWDRYDAAKRSAAQ